MNARRPFPASSHGGCELVLSYTQRDGVLSNAANHALARHPDGLVRRNIQYKSR